MSRGNTARHKQKLAQGVVGGGGGRAPQLRRCRLLLQLNASPRTDKTSPIEMADFVYPEFSKRISETISAREEEKRRQQSSALQQQQNGNAFGSSSASADSSPSSFSSGGGFLDGLFKKCKIESGGGGSSEQSALLYKGKQ